MAEVKPLYTPTPGRPMRVAGFMSGSGSNLIKIIQHQHALEAERGRSPYEVAVIFSDDKESSAYTIASWYDIPQVIKDIMDYYLARGHKTKRDLSLRQEFDERTVSYLADFDVDVIALAGYMSIVTEPLLEAYDGRILNVHPADLTVEREGRRAYTGDRAVADAILAGERSLRSTVHIVRSEVDYGELLMVSPPLPVELPEDLPLEALGSPENRDRLREVAGAHQDDLKALGDWVIFPRALEMIAEGRFGLDPSGRVTVDGESVPGGVRLEA